MSPPAFSCFRFSALMVPPGLDTTYAASLKQRFGGTSRPVWELWDVHGGVSSASPSEFSQHFEGR